MRTCLDFVVGLVQLCGSHEGRVKEGTGQAVDSGELRAVALHMSDIECELLRGCQRGRVRASLFFIFKNNGVIFSRRISYSRVWFLHVIPFEYLTYTARRGSPEDESVASIHREKLWPGGLRARTRHPIKLGILVGSLITPYCKNSKTGDFFQSS